MERFMWNTMLWRWRWTRRWYVTWSTVVLRISSYNGEILTRDRSTVCLSRRRMPLTGSSSGSTTPQTRRPLLLCLCLLPRRLRRPKSLITSVRSRDPLPVNYRGPATGLTSSNRTNSQLTAILSSTLCKVNVWCIHVPLLPRAGSGVVRMDPLRFLAGCPTRRLNQA